MNDVITYYEFDSLPISFLINKAGAGQIRRIVVSTFHVPGSSAWDIVVAAAAVAEGLYGVAVENLRGTGLIVPLHIILQIKNRYFFQPTRLNYYDQHRNIT